MPPTARAAALVITGPAFAASEASEHARTWVHADLEHGFGTQWGVGDARVLDHRAFDVEKPVEYPVHQALFGCFFLVVKHPTQKALFSYSHNVSTTNHHPRKQQ